MTLFRPAYCLLPLVLLVCGPVLAQRKFTITGRVKVEGGGLENTRMVIYKNGEKDRTVNSGLSKFVVDLDFNASYVMSFEKDGFVTKKLVFETKAPAEAVSNGFAPFEFAVSLFKQYDDVNIVMFNQPVGIIRYEPEMDDFNYDTDYTKSIQSQLQEVMEQVVEKQKEEEEKNKELEKQAAETAKAKAKADAEAAKQAAVFAKQEEERKAAEVRQAEEERKAAEARQAEEARKIAQPKKEEAPPPKPPAPVMAKEEKPKPPPPPKPLRNSISAQVVEGSDGRRSIVAAAGEEARPELQVSVPEVVRQEELIVETNKVVTLIRLEQAGLITEFRRIAHKWGGVFYFKNGDSCTKEVSETEALASAGE
ncbi:MAG: hypothetical protein IPI41_06155 [Flavobacteriales bacterium]|nr:hypothetical protein [Flavobacteriales bacterium]